MLRISEYIKTSLEKKVKKPFSGRIVIWNIINSCNLSCIFCYSSAKKAKQPSYFDKNNIKDIVKKLSDLNTKFVVLSGGEPLLYDDIYYVSELLKEHGINVSLSTNGLLIDNDNIELIKTHFDYVGISIDGKEKTHDTLRGLNGAYKKSIDSIKLLLENNVKVGIRFTLTNRNFSELLHIFELASSLGVRKLYISHLVNSGRANNDLYVDKKEHKKISEAIILKAMETGLEIVTGNNEQDAVILTEIFKKHFPNHIDYLMENLKNWGGNQSGVRLLNLDYKGYIKPDPFFDYKLAHISNNDLENKLKENHVYKFLNAYPRKITGKCQQCQFINICNGGSRARAFNVYNDYSMEDPSCFI